MALAIESYTDIAVISESTFDVTLPSGTAADDLLVAIIAKDDDIDMASSHGMSGIYHLLTVAYACGLHAWWKIAVAADITRGYMTFTSDDEDFVGRMYRITGFDTDTPIDARDEAGASGSSAVPQAPTLETITDGALVFAATGMDDNDVPYTLETGAYDVDLNTSVTTAGIVIATRLMATAGFTGVCDFTTNASDGWHASQFAIRPFVDSGTTYYEAPAATMVSSTTLSMIPGKQVAATMVSSAALAFQTSHFINATMTGIASLVKKGFVTIAATMVGSAVLSTATIFLQAVNATMVGVATLTKLPKKQITATLVGTATLVKKGYVPISATMIGVASLVKQGYVTCAATMTGVVNLAKGQFLDIAATMTGLAVLGTSYIPYIPGAASDAIRHIHRRVLAMRRNLRLR